MRQQSNYPTSLQQQSTTNATLTNHLNGRNTHPSTSSPIWASHIKANSVSSFFLLRSPTVLMWLLKTLPAAMLVPSISYKRTMVNLYGSAKFTRRNNAKSQRISTRTVELELPPNPEALLTQDELQEKVDMVSSSSKFSWN